MSSTGVVAPAVIPRQNYPLLVGGYFSLAFAVLQLTGIWWSPRAIKYLGGPAQLSIERPIVYAILCVAVAAIAVVFGVYALSGAGKIRHLPSLRTVLAIVSGIYLLRGILAIPQAFFVVKHPELVRFFLFSLISFAIGLLYLAGLVALNRKGAN